MYSNAVNIPLKFHKYLYSMGMFYVVYVLYALYGCGSISSGLDSEASSVAFSPSGGPIGTLLTLSGMDFSNVQSVTVGGTATVPVSNSISSYVGLVMPGTVSGSIAVTSSTGETRSSSDAFTVTATGVPTRQQGLKLVGTGAVGAALQAGSDISADGNTVIASGGGDQGNTGAVWVFTRSGGVWTQQGSKLVGTGAVGAASQGYGANCNADCNTILSGGADDDAQAGAAWIFTRNEGVWSQQGSKLVGTGAVGAAMQGWGVLSADGNTALIGGAADNGNVGATWAFTRSDGVWTQQGSKFIGSGAVGAALQCVVAVSADGNTALIGGPGDDGNKGAAWIFTRSGGVWTQQGSKLVGSGAVGAAFQGNLGALSADGNTALVSGQDDNGNVGATWVFTRSGGVWTQQGAKLVGSGNIGASGQGNGLSLTADGNVAMISGPADNTNVGAVWVFTRSGGVWTQYGSKLQPTDLVGAPFVYGGISLDGTAAVFGGLFDNGNIGATWIFTQ
jgi:hypothetical protein